MRKREDAEFEREMAFHVDAMTAENVARGMEPAEARRRALVDFGGRAQVAQRVREVHLWAWLEGVRFHLRSALRFVRRTPSLAFAVVATLALGVGANSAVFSVVDAVLVRPLPFPHGDELVRVRQRDATVKAPESFVSTQRLEDVERLNSTFQAVTGYYTGDATLTGGEMPEKTTVAFVAPRFVETWGLWPALGRGFTAGEHLFHGASAVLVTDRFWRTHMGADPAAVGKALRLGAGGATVVGVLPRGFEFPDAEVDLFEPNPVDAPYTQDRRSTWFTVIGRLKPGVTVRQAQADLLRVEGMLARQYPATDAPLTMQVQPLKAVVTGGVQGSLWLLYGAVTVLLVIACTNIAALLMARTAEREHEIAIRFALGARRRAIVWQLLTETFALVCAGAVLGLLLASGTGRLLAMVAKDLPRLAEVGLHWRLVAYTGVCTVVVTLLCGAAPALVGTRGMAEGGERRTLAASMGQAGYTQVSSRGSAQWVFVGVQTALAVGLLIASGLLVRSFAALARVDSGFETGHVLTLRVSGTWAETTDMGKLQQRVDRMLAGLRGLPGVRAAATSGSIPGNSVDFPTELKVVETAKTADDRVIADVHYVSTGYFATMGIPVLLGDACRDGLSYGTVVVNRSFAAKYMGGSQAMGMHLKAAADFIPAVQVVGIAADAREQGVNVPAVPTVYWCFSAPNPDPNYLVRVDDSPMTMAETVRRAVHALEPTRSVFAVMPLDAHLADRGAETRLLTALLAAFAITAVLLVSLGLYGTVSYMGRQRRREIGLRLALGALPREIVRRFVGQGLRVTALGAAAGLVLGAAMSRLLVAKLYGVSPLDGVTYGAVVALTLGVALLAALLPAVRAVRVDPTETLREQ